MFESLTVFRLAASMARHAGRQQALISRNVAHADTPGYRGSRLPAFSELHGGPDAGRAAQRASRPGHLNGTAGAALPRPEELRGSAVPNGNTISLEVELFEAAQARTDHDRALAIYKSGLDMLRATLRS